MGFGLNAYSQPLVVLLTIRPSMWVLFLTLYWYLVPTAAARYSEPALSGGDEQLVVMVIVFPADIPSWPATHFCVAPRDAFTVTVADLPLVIVHEDPVVDTLQLPTICDLLV